MTKENELKSLNLNEQQTARLTMAFKVLGEETSMRMFMQDLLWCAVDTDRALRAGASADMDRRRRVVKKMGELRVALEMMAQIPWAGEADLSARTEESIRKIELEAQERGKRNQARRMG